jgi:hypothetical protein
LDQLTITNTGHSEVGQDVAGYFSADEWAEAAQDTITLDEVRQALSHISTSLSDTVIAHREER